jgi:hypothetical protein
MATYSELPPGVLLHYGDEDANTIAVTGTRSETTTATFPATSNYTYSYGVYTIFGFGGDDTVSLTDITAVDPAGVNPRARQVVDGGLGTIICM